MTALEAAGVRLSPPHISLPLHSKWSALIERLSSLGSAAVAYSGGVDSAFLAYAAFLTLGERMVAVTIHSPLESPEQLALATHFAGEAGFPHQVLSFDPLQHPFIRSNPADRCYHCKLAILRMIRSVADQHQFRHVLEGQNSDDQNEYRPGRQAVLDTGSLSPLLDAELSKAEVRQLAKTLDLSVWDQPSSPCLATRFPYDTPLSEKNLQMVAAGESFLRARGFNPLRLRHHNHLARIEIPTYQFPQFLDQREEIVSYFKQLGFLYVVLDLQGYRSGSMDEAMENT